MENNQEYVEIKGIPFIKVSNQQLLDDHLYPALKAKRKTFIVTANPEIVMEAEDNNTYKQIIKQADYVVADGIGVVIGSKLIGNPLPERIAGYDLMQQLLERANQERLSCYFLGSNEVVLGKAVENIANIFPDLVVAGKHHGYFDLDDAAVADAIERTQPDIIFVGLGFPNQEKWIHRYYSQFNHGLFMGVGGSLDGLAGYVKRAPKIWQKLNVEWLYRLIKQPSRWKRMLQLPRFIWHILWKK
ncbi:WecB/TagA/CpsF family glycosyltransferase [Halobacillus shinanisalinarum]|uniref:N-acetylglucosaminyldiphosphoundecaprenol N-acetyl-beta-D-mannosaminyltransferase n=1 Tax=Halobacillus shinanisalinarum TaxID=2932258 RepID=A0ABY4H248_9BACI|nr:WecB/TagA/CpsF family glycosyltransferase [Halobacillus shinanisalinarum]UOQ94419.1 WecB/TagA/CpsF family glycosyltransferase [Halobacillus shinanisalinarum]